MKKRKKARRFVLLEKTGAKPAVWGLNFGSEAVLRHCDAMTEAQAHTRLAVNEDCIICELVPVETEPKKRKGE